MAEQALGKLERVTNISAYWPDEAHDFTPWLAKPDNLALIGDALGDMQLDLESIDTEQHVGRNRPT